MKKIISMVIVVVMVFAMCGTALAAPMSEYVDGQVVVTLEEGVTVETTYEALFPELAGKIDRVESELISGCGLYSIEIVLVLDKESGITVDEAIELLKENPNVKSAGRNTCRYYVGEPLPGDLDRDCTVSNSDLIDLARCIIGVNTLTEDKRISGDLNNDGSVSNSDLVELANEMIYDHVPPELTNEKKSEMLDILSVSQNKGYVTYIFEYYGTFSGCDVVYTGGGGGAALTYTAIEDLWITYPDTSSMLYVFKDGDCMTIDAAYEEGWITLDDVMDIWGISCGYYNG